MAVLRFAGATEAIKMAEELVGSVDQMNDHVDPFNLTVSASGYLRTGYMVGLRIITWDPRE